MGRRGSGEGTIGRWRGGWRAGLRLKGNRRVWLYGKTRREVADKLAVAVRARADGRLVGSPRQTVGVFLDRWLESTRPTVRASTWIRYAQLVRVHMLPSLSKIQLGSLTAQHLEELYAERIAAGAAPRSVHHVHAVLRRALNVAGRWGLIVRNPTADVDPPRVPGREMRTLSEEQLRALLTAAAGERLEALFVLAVTTGMRQGELLGLRWRALDLDARSLNVTTTLQRATKGYAFGEPKTKSSRRRIELSRQAIAALRRHHVAQAAERLAAGTAWENLDLVFANEVGHALSPSELTNVYHRRVLKHASLERIRFHDLRHTAATILLGRGVHPKIVSEMLGHTSIAITLDLYSHVIPTMQRDAAAAFDLVIGAKA